MQQNQINRFKVVLVEQEQGQTGNKLAMQLGINRSTVFLLCSNKLQLSLEMLDKIATIIRDDRRELINKSK